MWINSNQNKGAKIKTKKTPKAHIFDEEVWDIAGLFGSQEDDFEEPTNTNNSQNNESQKEEIKSDPKVEVDSKSIEHNESIEEGKLKINYFQRRGYWGNGLIPLPPPQI